MSVAVNKQDGNVDIYLDNGGSFSLPFEDFTHIRSVFSEHKMLTDMIIRPTAVINFVNESNPYLLDTEINIEVDKVRRQMANQLYDMAKIAIPFSIIIISAVVAWTMLMQGSDAGGANAVVNAASNVAPVVIK